MIAPNDMLKLILEKDYLEIQKQMKNGFDPNQLVNEQHSAVQIALFLDDYKLLYIFWKNGVKSNLNAVNDIFEAFANGKIVESRLPRQINNKNIVDLTHDFSIIKVLSANGIFRQLNDSICSIELGLKTFKYQNEIQKTKIIFDKIPCSKPSNGNIKQIFTFPQNPQLGYVESSSYIYGAHHPVDLLSLEYLKINSKSIVVQLQLHFVWAVLGIKDEAITQKFVLKYEK